MKDVDTATEETIEQYRKQLVAEAELADGDLAEIEDHLRTLTDDLRVGGMPAAEAVTEAARRLGDPKHLAREHSRVRSPFGARLSRARAWSAAALLVPVFVMSLVDYHQLNRFTVENVLGLLLSIALLARLSWARASALGIMGFLTLPAALATVRFGLHPAWMVWHVGVLAFLVPWRRGEITTAGWSLTLGAWTYGAASAALMYRFTNAQGEISIVMPAAALALMCSAVATIGGVLRARWSALLALVSAVALWGVAGEVLFMRVRLSSPTLLMTYLSTIAITGAIAATVATVIALRTTQSRLGTLRHVLR